MTPPVIARTELADHLPPLFADQSVIALVAAAPDDAWAAAAAWEIARAAVGRRRVAIVDVSLDQPALDGGAKNPAAEGLVDAFEFGSSLSHVAQEQDPGLFYIPVGTSPSDPDVVHRHPRWQRLSRGFASEGALLLLYVPIDALDKLAVEPDGAVLLAPEGIVPEHLGSVPVLAVVREVAARDAPASPRTRIPWRGLALGAGGVVATAAIAVVILTLLPTPEPDVGPLPAPVNAAAEDPPAPVAPAPPPIPEATGDTLYYSLQVAAFNRLGPAVEYADELVGAGYAGMVSPVMVGSGAIWYRVLVGAQEAAAGAAVIRQALWDAGMLARDQGVILRTAEALEVGRYREASEAAAAHRTLRVRGIPGYIVAGQNGISRLFFGAFENPEQARAADSLLAAAGVSGTLVSRIGTPR